MTVPAPRRCALGTATACTIIPRDPPRRAAGGPPAGYAEDEQAFPAAPGWGRMP
jgi:hypothetical protein